MNLSINTGSLREKFGDLEALKIIKEAGFDAVDYSMCDVTEHTDMLDKDYLKKAEKIKEQLEIYNLSCHQAHAPYLFKFFDEMNLNNENYLKLVRSIEFASIIGAKNIVIHHVKNDLPDTVSLDDYNLNFYKSLEPYAKKFNIKISVETLYKYSSVTNSYQPLLCEPARMLDFINKLNSDCFNICVDTGHLGLTGYSPGKVIRALGKGKTAVLHIHDIDYTDDTHTLPYFGKLDWNDITSALSEVEFNGVFSMEILLNKFDNSLIKEYLALAEKIGRYLINKIKKV